MDKENNIEQYSDIYLRLYHDMKDEYSDMSESEYDQMILNKSKELYEFENEIFSKYETIEDNNHKFNINTFLDGLDDNYDNSIFQGTRLDKDYLNRILKYPKEYRNEIIQASYALYNLVQEYKGLIQYMGDMLKYQPVINPVTDDVSKEEFIDALKGFQGYHYEAKLNTITKRLLLNDVYFGYEYSRRGTRNKILKELPRRYCRLLGQDEFGVYQYKFDLSFFNQHKEQLKSYPQEFQLAYEKYNQSNDNKYKWFTPDNKKQFAFKLDTTIDEIVPHFSGLFVEMTRLQDIKDAQAESSKTENYKLVYQKIPMDTKSGEPDNLLINYEWAKHFHNNAKAQMPSNVGILTTPMDVEGVTLKNANEVSSNIVDRHFSNLLSSAGVSRLLFNSDKSGSTGVKQSVKVDEGKMFTVLRKYENFFNRQFYYKYNANKFKIKFLDMTNHNREEVIQNYFEASQFGFNKFYLSAALDISQLELIYGNKMENELGINDMLKPLKSSHTQSGNDSDDLSDAGEESQDFE